MKTPSHFDAPSTQLWSLGPTLAQFLHINPLSKTSSNGQQDQTSLCSSPQSATETRIYNSSFYYHKVSVIKHAQGPPAHIRCDLRMIINFYWTTCGPWNESRRKVISMLSTLSGINNNDSEMSPPLFWTCFLFLPGTRNMRRLRKWPCLS